MDEKGSVKISLSTFFLLLTIIVIIIMGFFMYKLYNEKNEEKEKSTELQAQVDTLNGSILNLQSKIDKISNTINSSDNSANKESNNNSKTNSYIIKGTYTYKSPEDSDEYFSYEFSGNKVTLYSLAKDEGTFEIVDDKVIVTLNKFYTPEGKIEDENAPEKKEVFTIVDNNTLTQTVNGKIFKYIKE